MRFVKDKAQEVIQANKKVREQSAIGVHVERQIAWDRPENGWVNLNTYGASRGNPGLATACGALRDEDERWIGGFALNIGICSLH